MNGLNDFIAESNQIEGIRRTALSREVEAHITFLALERVTIKDLEKFVGEIQPGAQLRSLPGMDVRVAEHLPPRGGPGIVERTEKHIAYVNECRFSPWNSHVMYETLHPFMDGNGRSGRVLWAWQMLRKDQDPFEMPFLQRAYYQALDSKRIQDDQL